MRGSLYQWQHKQDKSEAKNIKYTTGNNNNKIVCLSYLSVCLSLSLYWSILILLKYFIVPLVKVKVISMNACVSIPLADTGA